MKMSDAIYLFTSGTTGQAKACVIGHKNLHHYFTEIAGQREIPAGERFLSVHPLFPYEWRAFYFKLHLSWCYDDFLS